VVSAHGIDLVVMGSHGASGLKKLALGSVAESALRHNPAPVMIVGPKCEGAPRRFASIVFATDLGVGCLRPAQYAAAMAEENNARITLLHVVPESFEEATGLISEEETRRGNEAIRREMEALLPSDADLWSRPSLRVEHGTVDEQILKVAQDEKADLIVMGTRDGGPLSDHAPWSTLSKVIRGAACPVLAVRAHTE
ncbi:MAG: universal stress protein, partial [Candidatus Korobacteraceae bacterium]